VKQKKHGDCGIYCKKQAMHSGIDMRVHFWISVQRMIVVAAQDAKRNRAIKRRSEKTTYLDTEKEKAWN
jgi:hypothetical protein